MTVRNTVKLKINVRGLDVIQSVYAFAVALGLTQVFTGSQIFLTRVLSGTTPLTEEKTLLMGLLLVNVALLGLRFFWAPRNLQGLVIAAARAHAIKPHKRKEQGDLSNAVIGLHLTVIFLHGALFFLICGEFEFIAFSVSSNLPMSASVFVGYTIMHVVLLLMNAAWIAMIKMQEKRYLPASPEQTNPPEEETAGDVWWRNNLVASLVAIAPFTFSSTCRSAASQCVQQATEGRVAFTAFFPTSPHVFATTYYDLVSLLANIGLSSPYAAVYWVFLTFLANSLYDLLNAGRFYVFFEDVEWEQSIEDTGNSSPLDNAARK